MLEAKPSSSKCEFKLFLKLFKLTRNLRRIEGELCWKIVRGCERNQVLGWVHLNAATCAYVDGRATIQGLVNYAARKRGLVAIMQIDQFDYRNTIKHGKRIRAPSLYKENKNLH